MNTWYNITFQTKCECYLPERDGTFGDVRVQVKDISERDSYIIRHLTLTVSRIENISVCP